MALPLRVASDAGHGGCDETRDLGAISRAAACDPAAPISTDLGPRRGDGSGKPEMTPWVAREPEIRKIAEAARGAVRADRVVRRNRCGK